MAKVSFTAGRVRDFTCPPDKKQVFLWDSATAGLGLRVTSGSKNYIFQGKLAGEAVRIKIGSLSTYSIDAAREQARTLKKTLDQGRDPRIVKAEITAADVAKRALDKQEQATTLEA